MNTDYIWTIVGLFFGYLLGLNNRKNNIPENLEQCNSDRSKLEEDVLYYKSLTKKLVEENKELRKKINEA